MEENKEIKGIDCKFIIHKPSTLDPNTNKYTEDTHWVKERIVYKDGSTKNNFRVIKNFQRPFWITQEHKRNHKQKKETESLSNVTKHTSTQSDLWRTIGRILGKVGNQVNPRTLGSNPYIYGTDIDSRVFLKKYYQSKYPGCFTFYTIAALDIENDIETDQITMISLAREWEVHTVILKSYIERIDNPIAKLNKIFKEHIPLDHEVKVTYEILPSELDLFKRIMEVCHQWEPDILAIWNMDHELSYFTRLCERNNVRIEDYLSDPSVPPNMRFFKYKKKAEIKISASGVPKASNVQDRWNTVYVPAKFYIIDAMCAYNYVRAGGKKVPTGYSLDSILNHELGSKFKKLKFPNLNNDDLYGADWHRFMSSRHPLEYIVYNQWDVLSMLVLDIKTNDMRVSMPTLLGCSTLDVFDSGPKRVVNSLMFKALSSGKVLGTRPDTNDTAPELQEHLGLDNWIITLPSSRLGEFSSLPVIEGDQTMPTTINTMVADADQVSGYPSCTMEMNVSRSTTLREVLSIKGIPKDTFKKENINLMFGPVSHLQYVQTMMKFPKISDLDKYFKEKLNITQ